MQHVILGAGTAGINAIRTMRQHGCADDIILISAEPPYSRMVLPYMLKGEISEARTTTLSYKQLHDWKVETRFGVRVQGIDCDRRCVLLDDQTEQPFDTLLIATGSSAARPALPGADHAGVHHFWTLDDAQQVLAAIKDVHHVVMIGAGFISFTILDAVRALTSKLTVIEAAPRILPRMVDATAADLVTRWLQANGVDLVTGAEVRSITDAQRDAQNHGARALRVELQDGNSFEAGLVLMATGIRPNLTWLPAEGAIARGEHGIRVNASLETSVKGIYAAGDVAEGPERITGAPVLHAIEPTAMEHGRIAARNMMAGADATPLTYRGSLSMNIVGVAGLDVASFGHWHDAQLETITGLAAERFAYRNYRFKDGRMVGGLMVSPQAQTWSENELGMLKGLIQSGQSLANWKGFLQRHPFELKQPFLALGSTAQLMAETVLDAPTPSP